MKYTLMLLGAAKAQEWVQNAGCSTQDYLAYDLKLIQDPGLYTGLIELPDCANYCENQRESLGLKSEVTCCLQAKYYYALYQIWAADCALVDAESTTTQDELWEEGTQVWTSYYAFIAQPDADFKNTTDPHPEVPEDYMLSEQAFPVDWRENVKWNDGQFCNVTDPMTDYLLKVDSETSSVDDRQKCYDYCSENRVDTKATCCGVIFENRKDENGDWMKSKLHCGLYFADLVEMPSENIDGGFNFYTSLKLGDGLLNKIEDAQVFVQDTINDWFKDSASNLGAVMATGIILASMV